MSSNELLAQHLKEIQPYENDFRWFNLRKIVIGYLQPGSVLDVGCGSGHMTLEVLRKGWEVTATDISPEMVNLTKKLAEKEGFFLKARLIGAESIRGLGENLFDNVVCLDVLEHVKDDEKALRGMFFVLKPKGRLVIVVPSFQWLYGVRDREMGHYRRYSAKKLRRKLERAGFKIVKMRYWNFLGLFPTLFFEKILRRRIYEGMRYQRKSRLAESLNSLLRFLLRFEEKIHFPLGLSLIAVCEPTPRRRK